MVMDGVIGAIVSELMVGLEATEELPSQGYNPLSAPPPPASCLFTWQLLAVRAKKAPSRL